MKEFCRIFSFFVLSTIIYDTSSLMKIESKMQNLHDISVKMNVSKRTNSDEESSKNENDQKAIFDKDLNVSYLPSRTQIAEGNQSKLPSRKRKEISHNESAMHKPDQLNSTPNDQITESHDDFNRLSSKLVYRPRKTSSNYSQNKKTIQNREKLQLLSVNDPKKFAEHREKARLRKRRSVMKLRKDPKFREQIKKHTRFHCEKLKRFRKNVREGIATEKEIKVVSRIREKEREYKSKKAKDE